MKLALHPVILSGSPDLDQQLAIARDAGYAGLDIDIMGLKARAEEQGLEAVRGLFASYGVAPAGCGLPLNWQAPDAEFETALEGLGPIAQFMVDIDCPRTFTYIMPTTEGDPNEYWLYLIDRFHAVGEVLADYGVRLGLEWLGPAHIRASGKPVIHTMAQTLQLIKEIDLFNLGLLFDVWHWFTSEGTIEEILDLYADQIVHVHWNDAPDKPLADQVDSLREVPGRGIIPLVDVYRALVEIGYEDYLSVEIFNAGLPDLPAMDAAKLVKAACDEIAAKAGASADA
jgi:sugar phosphate isomerase/epimerase